jgi:hypothetical protein
MFVRRRIRTTEATPWGRALIQKLTVVQPLTIFQALYVIQSSYPDIAEPKALLSNTFSSDFAYQVSTRSAPDTYIKTSTAEDIGSLIA